ncbi:hypothetical protein KOAAANKH_02466 [Brevundimonas sp. NIBR10]|uniref:hypothetical protein n=1 Tax=Brevundimonas sp. NIBR10 TaxID=3015997 RepID=UPI0022F1DA5D|nr:hypothetical protein [Brevundimonas sp. NIBR10]WGM47587.1 hypothetical protein KOAAANKH_02466 [Brevundimonas sp. NIBR10]
MTDPADPQNAPVVQTTPTRADPATSHPVKRALWRIGDGTARLIGNGREALNEGLESAGASIDRLHRRLAFAVLALVGVMVIGAAFRAWGWQEGNYALIALIGTAALWAVINPLHLIGIALAGGGLAAWKGKDEARLGLLAYARVLAVVLLGCLTPLVLFAVAPGDTSFWLSMRLLVLTPVVILALWLVGKIAPRAEQLVFIAVPAFALVLALGNMLVPEQTLAGLGIPAWLRAPRPQDEELARLERVIEQRRNEARAARLRDIRIKIERGVALTPEDEATIAEAQRDRVTLTDWVGTRSQAVLEEVRRRSATAPKPAALTAPAAGVVVAPSGAWSKPIAAPAGSRLCAGTDRGEAAYLTQCAMGDGEWTRRSAGGCEPGLFDTARFMGRGG